MKKFLRPLSALLLCFQTISLISPLNVLAEENVEGAKTSEVSKTESSEDTTDTDTTDSSSIAEETTETSEYSSSSESSTESSTAPSSEPTKPTTTPSSSQKPSQPKEEKPAKQSEGVVKTADVQPAKTVEVQKEAENEKPVDPQVTYHEPKVDINEAATAELNQFVPSSTVVEDGSIHFEKNESVDSFIRKIGEPARKIGEEKDLYASVMIAQAILESASGQSELSRAPYYNLFGIKGTHRGKTISFATQEDFGDGNLYSTQAGFRVYENYEDCFEDYAKLLKEGLTGNSKFYEGVWKSNAKTYKEATAFLTGKYATDTQYNQKLNGLIETYDLTEYDKPIQKVDLNSKNYIKPLDNFTISSPFGQRGGEFHRGLDMAAGQGEPIKAIQSGKVVKAEFHDSWGNYVAVQHDGGVTTLYAHQSEYVVKVGDEVKQGQIIGYVGSTGNSTGNHLHLEISRDPSLSVSSLLNPADFIFD